MAHNGYFGLKNANVALLTDLTSLTYSAPVALPGIVELKLTADSSEKKFYGDDITWLDLRKNNGFTGTMKFYDLENADTDSKTTLRTLIAKLVGAELSTDGRMIGYTDLQPAPFALMAEQTGAVKGVRSCYLDCTLGRPSIDAKTAEKDPDVVEQEYSITAIPVVLANGRSADHYKSYPDSTGWATFFKAVDVTFGAAA